MSYRESFGAYLGQDLFYLTAFAEAYVASLDKAAQVQRSHARVVTNTAWPYNCDLAHGRDPALRCCSRALVLGRCIIPGCADSAKCCHFAHYERP